MSSFNFTGDQNASAGTSFDFLSDISHATGASYYSGGPFGNELISINASNDQPLPNLHSAIFEVTTDSQGRTWQTGLTGYSWASNSTQQLLTGLGFHQLIPINYDNYTDPASQDAIRDIVQNLFSGDDNFKILGTVSAVWGDYSAVPTGGTVVLGDDFFRLGDPSGGGGVSLASGYGSITVFGDAQTAGAGTTSIAGDDIIDGKPAAVPLTLYGDFQTVAGKVTYGNDKLSGSSGADTLYGDSQSSTGAGGNDVLDGRDGNDTLIAGGGGDILQGGNGGDVLDGGAGTDFATYSSGVVADLINPAANTGEAAGDTYINIEGLSGGDYSFSGDDLRGDDNANTLKGRAGDDTLNGRGGADTLDGGVGADTLTGGAGDDRFIFMPGYGADTITDFAAGAGTGDKIDLIRFTNIHSLAGVLAHATEFAGSTTINFGNGDTLTLQGVAKASLSADDFVLNPLPTDFNADGKSDVLWQNDNGRVSIWEMNGANVMSNPTLGANPGPAWHVIGGGDFNADGHADILWQNDNGAVSIWEMDGGSVLANPTLSVNPGLSWHAIGTGDFNADGHSDILWQNDNGAVSIWEMNGVSVIDNSTLSVNPGPSWHAIGTGDFNADNKSDILWQNNNGAVSIWEMNGASVLANPTLVTNPGSSWHVKDAGDFNADGKSDILWQNTDGRVSIWEMNGASVITNPTLATNPGPAWHVVNAADYNGDAHADITWQNDSGAVSIWEMDGADVLANPTLGVNPGSSWHVIGPNHGLSA